MAISDLKRFRSLEQENQAIMIARLARADRMCAKGSGATGKRTGSVHVCWRSNVPWMCMHQHHGPPQRRRASDPDRYLALRWRWALAFLCFVCVLFVFVCVQCVVVCLHFGRGILVATIPIPKVWRERPAHLEPRGSCPIALTTNASAPPTTSCP